MLGMTNLLILVIVLLYLRSRLPMAGAQLPLVSKCYNFKHVFAITVKWAKIEPISGLNHQLAYVVFYLNH